MANISNSFEVRIFLSLIICCIFICNSDGSLVTNTGRSSAHVMHMSQQQFDVRSYRRSHRSTQAQAHPKSNTEDAQQNSAALSRCAAQAKENFNNILANNSNTTLFANETSVNITVTWTGDNDKIILVVTISNGSKPSSLYRSSDSGKYFENVTHQLKNLSVIDVQEVEQNRKQLVLIASNGSFRSNNTILLLTADGGLTFTISHLSFKLLGNVLLHPFFHKWFLAQAEEKGKIKAFLSKDGGLHWKMVQDDVKQIEWGTGITDNNETFYLLRKEMDPSDDSSKKSYNLLKTTNLGKEFTVIARRVKNFETKGKFIYALCLATKDGQKSILRVSTTGGRNWNEAQLPTMVEDQFYRILDMSEGMVFIHVDQPGDTGCGTLYTSDTDGIIFSESLKKHLFPNYEDVNDFYKVNSIRGVYLTSQLNDDHSVRTMVTFNRGATWQPVRKPSKSQCPSKLAECYLQMAHQFSQVKGVAVPMGPISVKSAVGIVITHGHVGRTLMLDPPDVFVSADGGYNWTKALKGPHLYAIADHGGLLVAVPGSPTTSSNTINFSTDEGQTWCSYQFTQEKIHITGLLTDPETWSQKVAIWGYGLDSVWRVTVIDFKSLLKRPCKEPEDFEDFMAHNELKAENPFWQGCLLGIKETFRKLKQNAWCYLGQSYQLQQSKDPCNCTEDDFECDFGYYRPANSRQCVENPVFKGAELDVCFNGEEMEIITTGYRKIPGDMCRGGFEPAHHYRKDVKRKCTDGDKTLLGNFHIARNTQTIANAFLTALVMLVTVILISMAVFFLKKCRQLNHSPLIYRYSRLTQEELVGDTNSNDEITQNSNLELENSDDDDDDQMQPATLLVDTSDTTTVDMKPKPVIQNMTSTKKFYFDESDDELLQ